MADPGLQPESAFAKSVPGTVPVAGGYYCPTAYLSRHAEGRECAA